MPDLNYIRAEIAHMRIQVIRQKRGIRELEEANISTESAVALLQRMEAKVEGLCADRDRLVNEEKLKGPSYASGKRIYGTPSQRRV
jgi:hypothetical protein